MTKQKEKKKIIRKLKHKYRLIIYNDNTFEEVLNYRLNRLNVFTIGGTIAVLLIALVTVLIAFTPLREFIPGYPDGETERNIRANYIKADSLEQEIQLMNRFLGNIKTIIEGDEPINYMNSNDTGTDYGEITFTKSKEDSLLRQKIEEDQRYNLSLFDKPSDAADFTKVHLFPPVNGVVTSGFNLSKDHYGTDIVSAQGEMIRAVMDGTVILAAWTLETGYIIQIQHENNFISIYKHINEKLVDQGTQVKAGNPIAIIGNSGELSTGTHLHFELWHNGIPMDAEEYIVFNSIQNP
ncbi:MAG: M23 family metallopeptidase [Bacteroidetes bacterium]|nr:M23 family metallopeptidase [Bacteroidota bacterium]